MHLEEEKLEAQMEYARYEHETELLRERKFPRMLFPIVRPFIIQRFL